MCGIAGIWDRRGASKDALLAQTLAITETLAHRGPDGQGIWTDPDAGVGLGHRRLAIVDLTETGAQPMTSHCGRYVITYNGEMYNAPALGRELESRGVCFTGTCDTEVLLAAISTWGLEPALGRAAGMFAFALWDRKDRSLTLVRDRIGKKPLFWYRRGNLLLFGSQMKALMRHPDFERDLDRNAVATYLRLTYLPSPIGIFAGVEKVAPGTWLRFQADGSMSRHVYWDLPRIAEVGLAHPRSIRLDEAVADADTLLREVTLERTLSDVPLGVFLSGGVDSSLVTALLQAQSDRPIRTFSAGFAERQYDESHHARSIATHLGTDHTELTVTAQDALDVIPRLSEWFDEPFADSSQIPTHLLSALTRRHVTVALSGDGGDEIAAGYIRHGAIGAWWPKLAGVPLPLRRLAARTIANMPERAWQTLAGVVPERHRPAHPHDKALKFARLLASETPDVVYRSLTTHWAEPSALIAGARDLADVGDDASLTARFPNLVGRFQYLDMARYLPDDVLCKVDRASMAVALEVRCPLLDHRVIEHFWSLPRRFLQHGNDRKIVLKTVLARYAPPALFERAKMGFGVPIDHWLRGPLRDWAEGLLDADRLRQEGLFETGPIRRTWQEHLTGRADHHHRLWSILMFQSWRERWLDVPTAASSANRAAAIAQAAILH